MKEKTGKISLIRNLVFVAFLVLSPTNSHALEETITVPAEEAGGVTIELEKGEYRAEIEGGAITLFYPINPNYCWLISVAVGTEVEGGQDEANIGIMYFEPHPPVYSQAEAEQLALEAVEKEENSTYLEFELEEDKEVRFWVSDFDYSDNSGMAKIRIYSAGEE